MFAPLSQRITSFAATCHRSARAKQQGRQVVRQSAVLKEARERERHMERAEPHSLSLYVIHGIHVIQMTELYRSELFGERTCRKAFSTNKLSECKSEKQAAHQSSVVAVGFSATKMRGSCMKRKTWSVQCSVRVGFAIQQHSENGSKYIFERAKSHTEAKQQQ